MAGAAYSNGLNLNSIGVKAGSMGGAFIGLADDYSAVYWNPAGISQIENPQLAGYFTGVMPSATYSTETFKIDAKSESQMFPVPGLMGYVPIVAGTINAGLGVYIPSGLGVTWNGNDFVNMTGGKSYEWMSEIGVVNIAPSVSWQILSNLSVGAAVNISYGFLDMKQPQMQVMNQQPVWGQYAESSSGWGVGATFGVLYQPIDLLSVGFGFKTANTISFEGTAEHELMKAGLGGAYKDADISREIAWPTWMGGGVALHLGSGVTVTADVQYTNWGSMDSIKTTYKNWEMAGLTENEMILKWEDRMQFRIGAEWEVLSTLAIRGGFYLDPAPAPDETLNILFPSIDYMGPTLGAAIFLPGFTIEGGFEYLMGTERDIAPDTPAGWANPTRENMPGKHNNNIFAFFVGFVWDI